MNGRWQKATPETTLGPSMMDEPVACALQLCQLLVKRAQDIVHDGDHFGPSPPPQLLDVQALPCGRSSHFDQFVKPFGLLCFVFNSPAQISIEDHGLVEN